MLHVRVGLGGVATRVRDAVVGVTLDPRVLRLAGSRRGAPNPFLGLSAVGLLGRFVSDRIRRVRLCLGPGRSREGLKPEHGPRTANENNEAIDSDVSTGPDRSEEHPS